MGKYSLKLQYYAKSQGQTTCRLIVIKDDMWDQLKNPRTVAVIVLTIVYYIVAIYIIYKYGYKWIIPVWSFPIVIIFIVGFTSGTHHSKFKLENKVLAYTAIAYFIVTLAIVASIIAAKCTMNRTYVIAAGIGVWIVAMIAFWWWVCRCR